MSAELVIDKPSPPDSFEEALETAPQSPAGDEEHVVAPTIENFSVRAIRDGLELSRRDFSRLTGFSERTIASWESGQKIGDQRQQRLKEIHEFQKALSQVMKPGSIGPWLRRPNSAFQGLKPLEVIERGEIHRLWRMIFYLQSGMPS